MKKYTPVSCDLYSTLELYAMRKSTCRLAIGYEAESSVEVETTIEDLFSREGIEYARLGNGNTIRLDQLLVINGMSMKIC